MTVWCQQMYSRRCEPYRSCAADHEAVLRGRMKWEGPTERGRRMTTGNFVVVALTQREARVWSAGISPGSKPKVIRSVDDQADNRHVRPAQSAHLHHRRVDDPEHFGDITDAIAAAGSVLLMGHGKGKSSAMACFIDHLERKHPSLAARVDGALDVDLEAMTEGQLLAAARDWHVHHIATT